jgi:hypothetical protein
LVLNESVWVKEEEGKERVVKALIREYGGKSEQQERLLTDPQLFSGGAAAAGMRIQAPEKGATARQGYRSGGLG